jgi:lipid-binding SYLF domain-containing protein
MLASEEGDTNLNSPGSVGSHPRRRKNKNSRLEREELEKEKMHLDEKASQFAFECEKRGMRTSYDELRNLFVGCTLPPKEMEDNGNPRESLTTPQRKSVSTFATPARQSNPNMDDLTIDDANSLLMADSIGGVFENGKNKKYLSSRCVPALPDKTAKVVTQNVTNVARNASACFRPEDRDNLDEGEGDDFYENGQKTKRSNHPDAIMLDTPTSPIKNEGLPSPRRQRGAEGMGYSDEQQLYPVVMVFRRTVQRKQLTNPRKGLWGSPGLSLRGSLFGIPSFRMDDECDRAAALVRQLAPSSKNKKRGTDGVFYGDDGENSTIYDQSVATSPDHRSGSAGSASDDNIEASTIRGMIQNAVGLGFVRTSKVVVGVSLQAGSGIIISRLPDGTWSAPSAIGVYGLGVGMQFGLEVADYMFILQTQEGVEHFQRGGNFALGGNIGISVAHCGREAYGAASLGHCAGSRSLQDQIQQGDSDDEGASTVFDDTTIGASTVMSRRQQKKNKGMDGGDIAPMVAYAKSQGLYFGVSVDGLKFFTRNDINSRAYKFSMLSEMAARDILGGLVAPPPEAEDLYAALHR